MLIFGYGSLMNIDSVRKTSTTAKVLGRHCLPGYQRKCNAMHEDFPDIAMNIVKNQFYTVEGAVIDFPESDREALFKREIGYELVDITDFLHHQYKEKIYTFIAPDCTEYGDKYVRQSYLDTCLAAVPVENRERWLLETVVECQIKPI